MLVDRVGLDCWEFGDETARIFRHETGLSCGGRGSDQVHQFSLFLILSFGKILAYPAYDQNCQDEYSDDFKDRFQGNPRHAVGADVEQSKVCCLLLVSNLSFLNWCFSFTHGQLNKVW